MDGNYKFTLKKICNRKLVTYFSLPFIIWCIFYSWIIAENEKFYENPIIPITVVLTLGPLLLKFKSSHPRSSLEIIPKVIFWIATFGVAIIFWLNALQNQKYRWLATLHMVFCMALSAATSNLGLFQTPDIRRPIQTA